MHVLILYNQPLSDRPDDIDTVNQSLEIQAALHHLGHDTALQAITVDLSVIKNAVDEFKPEVIFNGVEEYQGSSYYTFQVAHYLEALPACFTGCSSKAQYLSASKLRSKKRLAQAFLATPSFITMETNPILNDAVQYIVKSNHEHASLGIDEHSIVTGGCQALELIHKKQAHYSGRWFAEQYIDGREFNVALIGSACSPAVLPINEIVFNQFPAGVPKIVDYNAKWKPDSFSYTHTARALLEPDKEPLLYQQLKDMALRCWHLFELNGYARVDFRVDQGGRPWILEINTNPCLSGDGGFMASAREAGYSYEATISTLLKHSIA